MAKLTNKQQTFCNEYLKDLNATQSAIRAGYSKHSADVQGPRLLGNVRVFNEIERLKLERAKSLRVDQAYVINGIQDTIEKCRQLRPVDVEIDGEVKTVHVPMDIQGALRGLELLGRHLAMFTDKTVNTNTNLEALSDAELTRELTRAKQEAELVDKQDNIH